MKNDLAKLCFTTLKNQRAKAISRKSSFPPKWATMMGLENKTKQVFPFVVLQHSGPGFSRSVPQPARTAKKRWFSYTAFDWRHESSSLVVHAPRSVAAKFEGSIQVGCVSRSRLERGGLTQFCINFLRFRTGHFRSEKKIQKWVRLSRCLLYTSPSPRDQRGSRMPSSA